MATWIAFLRAINLGAKRKFAPAEIVAATQAAGFTDVATHINTGNVRLSTAMRSREKIAAALEAAYAADRGFEVPTLVFRAAEVAAMAERAAALAGQHDGKVFVSLLRSEPEAEAVAALEAYAASGERVLVEGHAAYLLLGASYHTSKLAAHVEKRLGEATNRNAQVLGAIADKWCR